MKVEADNEYSNLRPEEYNWIKLNSSEVQVAAERIMVAVYKDIQFTEDQILAPGLREALRLIAQVVDVY